ncbi:hypothetical protein ACRBEV_10140 [Methylobacterium phyllosphaerae]
MTPAVLLRMPPGDRAPALRQYALHRLEEFEKLEAEFAAKLARRRRALERLARLAKYHRVELPADVTARLQP